MKLISPKTLISTCIIAALLSSCGYDGGYELSNTTTTFKPTSAKKIKLNFDYQPFKESGICSKYYTVSTIKVSTSRKGAFLKQPQMNKKFKKIAASIGADAVIKISKESMWTGIVTGYAIKCRK